jgi:pentose-5-phosphate-3-epimerase
MVKVEIVPAILKKTFEDIEKDWGIVEGAAQHIQIDITDGVFAGDGTFREISRFKQLPNSEKAELHLMVHTPSNYVDEIIDLNPARCIFHVEAFEGTNDISSTYKKLREATTSELALATNPESPDEWLEEYIDLVDYVLFMGYNPGWANQPVNATVFRKIGAFHDKYPDMRVAVDGHVDKETIGLYVDSGARILCANTSVFNTGNPVENLKQLQLLATASAKEEAAEGEEK